MATGQKSKLEELYASQLDDNQLAYKRNWMFHPTRKWRIDFGIFFPSGQRIGIEIEGGLSGAPIHCQNCGSTVMLRTKTGKSIVIRQAGGHNTAKGYQANLDKYNEATLLGIVMLRFSGQDVKNGKAIAMTQMLIQKVYNVFEEASFSPIIENQILDK